MWTRETACQGGVKLALQRGLLVATVLWLVCFGTGCADACAQDPSLFLSNQDFRDRVELARREPWARQDLDTLLKEPHDFPGSYQRRFGLTDAAPPPEGGQWLHWYACPETGTPLKFIPPDQNICPDTGKNFTGYPYDHVVYQLRNDALAEAALSLGLAYRFSGKQSYAKTAISILQAYTKTYPTYTLHDNNGKPGINGAKAYSQTLDESIWLIKLAWTYDLVRGSGMIPREEASAFERDVLRASAETVRKAHKEPTYNIQSWINGAIAAVGYVVGDPALVTEAIDGPIGFRYQMRTFVHDGFWEEGAWGYQFYAMRPLTMLAQMASRHGTDLWEEEPALLSLFHGPLGVVFPDGSLPAFNDGGAANLYSKDYLYEVAYAATHDSALLHVLQHGTRDSREALLFGVGSLPRSTATKPESEVFREAGYAALRARDSDLMTVMKFGSHGGAHGHYDKLNFLLFAKGRTLAVDPGSQLYGLTIHREWDSKTIAHNTISVDEQRQSAATGKLLDWFAGDGWTAVRVDAGTVYPQADLQRTLLLTSEYVLVVDRCVSQDGQPHTFDWMYHNIGEEHLLSHLTLQPSDAFPQRNGYGYLHDLQSAVTDGPFTTRFVAAPAAPRTRDHNSNSTPETIRSHAEGLGSAPAVSSHSVQLDASVAGAPATQVFVGRAPGPDLHVPVPFLLVRRKGADVRFATLLTPTALAGDTAAEEQLTVRQLENGTFRIEGRHFVDTFAEGQRFQYQRMAR